MMESGQDLMQQALCVSVEVTLCNYPTAGLAADSGGSQPAFTVQLTGSQAEPQHSATNTASAEAACRQAVMLAQEGPPGPSICVPHTPCWHDVMICACATATASAFVYQGDHLSGLVLS